MYIWHLRAALDSHLICHLRAALDGHFIEHASRLVRACCVFRYGKQVLLYWTNNSNLILSGIKKASYYDCTRAWR
jgi:hypothetical protein